MFRIAICEDIGGEREKIIEKIDGFFQKENLRYLVNEYSSGESLLAEYQDGTAVFDLIFMDIGLGGMNGLDTASKIRAIDNFVHIAFLTSSRDYAIEGYEVGAVAYLLKPVEDEKFFTLLSKLTRTEKPKSLTLKIRGRRKDFDYRDIVYVESRGHRVILHLANGTEEAAYYKLDEIEELLQESTFVRTHKSYLVNMDYIRTAEDDFELVTGAVVPIRRHGRKEVINRYLYYTLRRK